MSRWSIQETNAIKDIRKLCKSDLKDQPPYPEVIGDRQAMLGSYIYPMNYIDLYI